MVPTTDILSRRLVMKLVQKTNANAAAPTSAAAGPKYAAMPVALFIAPLRLGMVIVALMDLHMEAVVFMLVDAFTGSGFTTFSYAEQFPFGANGQLSYPDPRQQLPNPSTETRHNNILQ